MIFIHIRLPAVIINTIIVLLAYPVVEKLNKTSFDDEILKSIIGDIDD